MAGAVLWACQPAMAATMALGSSTPPGGSMHDITTNFMSLPNAGAGDYAAPGSVGGMTFPWAFSYSARFTRLLRSSGLKAVAAAGLPSDSAPRAAVPESAGRDASVANPANPAAAV